MTSKVSFGEFAKRYFDKNNAMSTCVENMV